ncbi:GNAT family N-acetyltransferase [Rhodoferax sp.]|uniref:GNAT family N-acetyltransferase n=1 Tax=Rhodoferax sp. TaxID=50421 RepID=UPI0026055EF9|nr:GNAT family N-acetyltransferase [Rhodoferax sp.]MDD2808912.1 GNAT family N-acetyltransferase [Rhodoferax sp.]MDD4943798.1 GNAT family N-acetyltransferase [Rhodoferax sp.]MDD5478819.1 GNAT family N-acetyltransferase [Rhodoferax sp.]
MKLPAWHEEPIAKQHDRQAFDCGQTELNVFLQSHARQSHERGAVKTFLAVADNGNHPVLGYYSLSPASVEYARTPELLKKGLGHYDIGAFRLGRLAVHASLQGQGLGGQLLLAAGRRCLRVAQEVGGTVLLIDAKTPAVADWYASYGALSLLDAPLTLLLPLQLVASALKTSPPP